MSKAKMLKKRQQKRPSKSRGIRTPTPRPHRSDAQRAAIIALLLTGCTPVEIEKTLKVPESTVRNYRRELTPEQIAALNEKRANELDDLLWENIRAAFAAQHAILTHVQSQGYIQRQDPDALAVFYGVVDDKKVRILEAVERASGRTGSSDDTSSGEPDTAGEAT